MCMGVILVAIVLLAPTSARAAETKALEACKLLTLQDVQNDLGGGFAPAPSAGPTACAYRRSSDDLAGLVAFHGSVDAAKALKERQELQKKAGRAVTPVPGLGEELSTSSSTTRWPCASAKGPGR